MDIKSIVLPGLVIGILGGVFAVILSFVAKKFAVHHDEKLEEVIGTLPGLNCGGCGFPSCFGYAESVYYHSHVPLTFCKPGGEAVAHELARILGRKVEQTEKTVAKLLCRGGKSRAHKAFEYSGPATCHAAHLAKGGPLVCKQGCLGYGDCYRACTFDAIEMGSEKLPIIDRDKCVACGVCVKVCPHELIELIPVKSRVFVECKNHDKGALTTKACDVGCIACRLCVKECPVDAIHVIDNVAQIDYSKCVMCGKCVHVCPRNIIMQLPKLATPQKPVR
jgi:Na+-translocating ferredoxin:NAD+ oxidoreductase RNF subunit RnfB